MPSFPKTCRIGRLVGRVEVLGQVESHQHCYADGDVGVARKVGIDLKGIDEKRGAVLERRIEQRIVKHTVDETHSEVVAEDDFLEQTVQNPEHGDSELAAGKEEWFVELGHELVGADDGACHQLGEKSGVEGKIQHILHMRDFSFIDIHYVADILECEEGDAYWKNDLDGDGVVAVGDGVEDVGKEIGILEKEEYGEVYYHPKCHPYLGLPPAFGLFLVQQNSDNPSRQSGEKQQQHKPSRSLVVEEYAYQEEVGVSQ